MSDTWSLTLADVRSAFSELIEFYLQAMRSHERMLDHKLQAARLAQQALNDYLGLLNVSEVQMEIEQLHKIVGGWRSDLPRPFDEDERGPE
jgi:hypothetical protein